MSKKKYISIVLLISLSLSLALFLLMKDSKTPEFANEIWQINRNIRKFYGNRPGYWGLNTQSAIENNLIPFNMLVDGKIINAYGHNVKIGKGLTADTIIPGARGFDIIIDELSQKECIKALTFEYNKEFLFGVSGISIVTDKRTIVVGWEEQHIIPLSKQQAEEICKDTNNLIWHLE